MTNNQAIEKLNDIRCHVKETSIEEQALVMAINALKAQLSQEGTTKDTISRQAALEKVRTMQTYKLFTGDDMILVDKAEVQTELMMLPTVQPEPKEGHWINGKCDLCGEHAPFWAMASTYHESNYCPNCGAKMKGERQK